MRRPVSPGREPRHSSPSGAALRSWRGAHVDASRAPLATDQLHEKRALLFGPAGALRMRNALADGDAQILMPSHEPVPLRGLVKQRARPASGPPGNSFRDRGAAPKVGGALDTNEVVEQVARACSPAFAFRYTLSNRLALVRAEPPANDCLAVFVKH